MVVLQCFGIEVDENLGSFEMQTFQIFFIKMKIRIALISFCGNVQWYIKTLYQRKTSWK